MKSLTNQFILSVLAGISISIGCIVNLKVGCGIAGSVLFSIGLMMVVLYRYKLFTGTAGFIESIKDVFDVYLSYRKCNWNIYNGCLFFLFYSRNIYHV